MNIVYIGSAGLLSELPLQYLLKQGVSIRAIAMLGSTRQQLQKRPAAIAEIKLGDEETLASSGSLLDLAADYNVPVLELPDQLALAAGAFKALQTDLILMSCFPRRLPAEIFNLPLKGCFNLHPSILPAYRGPSPIHWQCMHKVSQSGVTVHQVNEQFDEGAIAVQKIIKTRSCVNKAGLAYQLALLGGEALYELLELIRRDELTLVPQQEEHASYFSFP